MEPEILKKLADYARVRVTEAKKTKPLEAVREEALAITKPSDRILPEDARFAAEGTGFRLDRALRGSDIGFICEVKKASPSKGLIAPDFPYLAIAKDYEAAGAAAISVLTEPKWFLGSNDYLREIAGAVKTPCLRKDFTVDPYMIYEAKFLGASAVLLICAILSPEELVSFQETADTLGLSSIVEAHSEEEIDMAVAAGARIIGINNRDLRNFTVDVHNAERLRSRIPENILCIAESGIQTAADIDVLRKAGVNGVLIGETLMRAADRKAKLQELRGKGVPA